MKVEEMKKFVNTMHEHSRFQAYVGNYGIYIRDNQQQKDLTIDEIVHLLNVFCAFI